MLQRKEALPIAITKNWHDIHPTLAPRVGKDPFIGQIGNLLERTRDSGKLVFAIIESPDLPAHVAEYVDHLGLDLGMSPLKAIIYGMIFYANGKRIDGEGENKATERDYKAMLGSRLIASGILDITSRLEAIYVNSPDGTRLRVGLERIPKENIPNKNEGRILDESLMNLEIARLIALGEWDAALTLLQKTATRVVNNSSTRNVLLAQRVEAYEQRPEVGAVGIHIGAAHVDPLVHILEMSQYTDIQIDELKDMYGNSLQIDYSVHTLERLLEERGGRIDSISPVGWFRVLVSTFILNRLSVMYNAVGRINEFFGNTSLISRVEQAVVQTFNTEEDIHRFKEYINGFKQPHFVRPFFNRLGLEDMIPQVKRRSPGDLYIPE